ncbi:MAG: hypothetical protein JSU70_09330 [Phycisphaerales bacterium]|nr:MAG: hypothetical protein JSU70_09330 [Phycisphaerales bacterium]
MAKKYTLLRSQKNRVFEILREEGLEPADFKWVKVNSGGTIIVSKLDYRDGTYYFQFSWYELNSWCVAAPGKYRAMEYEHPRNWSEHEVCFRNWTRYLKREINAPDLWTDIEKYRLLFSSTLSQQLVNEPISACEADKIREVLSSLAEKIEAKFELSYEQREFVRDKLDYLAEAARRQRCTDWTYSVLGVAVTIVTVLNLEQYHAETLWRLAGNELGQLIRLTV